MRCCRDSLTQEVLFKHRKEGPLTHGRILIRTRDLTVGGLTEWGWSVRPHSNPVFSSWIYYTGGEGRRALRGYSHWGGGEGRRVFSKDGVLPETLPPVWRVLTPRAALTCAASTPALGLPRVPPSPRPPRKPISALPALTP